MNAPLLAARVQRYALCITLLIALQQIMKLSLKHMIYSTGHFGSEHHWVRGLHSGNFFG